MKSAYSLLTVLFLSIYSLVAQVTNITFYSQDGDPFHIFLNNTNYTQDPVANFRLEGLIDKSYALRIVFKNPAIPEINQTLLIDNGLEMVYTIKRNKRDQYVLRWQSSKVIGSMAPATVHTPHQGQGKDQYMTQPNAIGSGGSAIVSQTTTSSTVSTYGNPQPSNTGTVTTPTTVGGNNPNAGGFNLNINITDPNAHDDHDHYDHSTTTTTTTIANHPAPTGNYAASGSGTGNTFTAPPSYVPGYNGAIGCSGIPMDNNGFNQAKTSISTKAFDSSQMTVAKQIVQNNCMLASQVREITEIFSFEKSKLDFAKFAYDYTYDLGNYYKINDVFDFESSISDLNSYISGK